jgi:predicted NAD/FAD-binding protein
MALRIAVVGSGISGLAAAWQLSREHPVVLFESERRLGGHTHTHDIEIDGRMLAVDTGFIVFNPDNYPLLSDLFGELGVASQPATMSFSVSDEASGLEYNAGSLAGLFCQRRNLASPRFLGMIADILRFYREAPRVLAQPAPGPTLGEYLDANRYGTWFRDRHLVPMASALWSSPGNRVLDFPLLHLLQFMDHHRMLHLRGRPEWRVVSGGSRRYIDALRRHWRVSERTGCAVRSVRRRDEAVEIGTDAGSEMFDHVVIACHGDDALALLADPTPAEHDILGAIAYQDNDILLHTDARLLPRRRRAWAAWNALVPREGQDRCTVSYCMNILQSLDTPQPLVVTLNRSDRVDPARILRHARYRHPLYTHASVAARARKPEIQGRRRTWYAGAYWGWGFHEDGMRSAREVADMLGASCR